MGDSQVDFFENDLAYLSKPSPFIQWMGGKRNLLDKIKPYFPKNFNNYYEPFVGGGAVFFSLGRENATISDVNGRLINAYRQVRDNIDPLIDRLKYYFDSNDEKFFYSCRANEPTDKLENAAWFIYLIQHCFGGMHQIDKKGNLRSTYDISILETTKLKEDNLRLCSKFLKGVDIIECSYNSIRPKSGDFVYMDPPYHDTTNNYNYDNFTADMQVEIKEFCDYLTKNGVKFIQSNSSNKYIKDLYKDYKIKDLYLKDYAVSQSTKIMGGKKKITGDNLIARELIIRNF